MSKDAELLAVLEAYYDAAPRPSAVTEEIGPFTLFLRDDGPGWPFYARPRVGAGGPISAADVERVRARQREAGAPEAFEWVRETTPALLPAARDAGLRVVENPLLVLPADARPQVDVDPTTGRLEALVPDSPDLPLVVGAIHAGFEGSDTVHPRPPGPRRALMERGLLAVIAAYDGQGAVVGGGSHGPRGAVTELTGIAVLPRARRHGVGAALTAALVADARARGLRTIFLSAQDDAVARVYERVGFVRVGTACVAEPEPVDVRFVGGDEWSLWRDIRLRALQDSPSAFGSTYEREQAFTEDDWRRRLDPSPGPTEPAPGVAVLAVVDERPVGMGAGFRGLPGWLHVVAMWTDPEWRGRGVGRQVLDRLVGWAGEHGLRVHLDVAVGNQPARRAYERCGFVATGETRPLRDGSAELVERMLLR